MSRVLVVDDDPQLRRALRITLRAAGFDVVTAEDGRTALAEAAAAHPDVVLLDLGLPDLDGTEVLAGLRPWFTGPVVVLSARGDSSDKVGALDAGADDYVTKPFDMAELLARLRVALRRGTAEPGQARVVTDHFTVDLAAKQVTVDGVPVRLTPTEWALLSELVRSPGRLVGQRELLQAVWGPAYERETNYLRVYLAQLRRKLEPDAAHPRYLLTEPGMGYRFSKDPLPPHPSQAQGGPLEGGR
ncbi:response regulator [Modestobacter italicus]|uniref:response regulator n=1 Tax=Modestobacter italicus (strain DSM 44449 / CECT 9708 / BC 501) TaxID=2732864 RepID=UPI001C94598A|nr:response regulator [Modestobacter italicus]